MHRTLLCASLAGILCLSSAGCGVSSGVSASSEQETGTPAAASAGSKSREQSGTFVFGDTTFNSENEESDIDPHNAYSGWAAIRYGVGETLFRFDDEMELTPWLAESYENPDETTWKITLRDGVTFSNGRVMDGEAVKECLEDLVRVHDRAAGDLKIASIQAEGQTLTIRTMEPVPTFLNYLSDPYGCIIDMQAGNENGIVVGTGPFIAEELETDDHLKLVKNDHYWGGEVPLAQAEVLTISDGDTLSMALQSGEIDAAYGMAYASYPLFEGDGYSFSTATTSRAFYVQMNDQSEVVQDDAVRKAIAMGIDKDSFVSVLLNGYGETATGPFPDSFSFGGQNLKAESYDPAGAEKVLEDAGWKDTDGDGIREKNGRKLTIRWVTYPSRQELPLLAESAQASLKEIGMDVQLNVTADHNSIVADPSAWDVYAAAFVTCPTGDPMYFFSTHCLDSSPKNRGGYHSDRIEELAKEMNQTFDPDQRGKIAIQMEQQILDDHAFVFCSFLRMSMISRKGVTGLTAHASDYYELTSDLHME